MPAGTLRSRLTRGRQAPLPPWALTALGCLCLAGLADVLIRHERGVSGDEPFYLLMAEHPRATLSFPYAFRVAVPWLVHVLPFAHVVSFQLITLLCIGLAGGVLFLLLQEFAVPPWLAAAIALTMAVCPNLLVVLIRHGQSVDPATTLVMLTGTLFIVRRERAAFAVTVMIGAAVKETDLFLLPFAYAVWARRPLDPAALRDTVLTGAGAVIVYAGLRLGVHGAGSNYTPGYSGSFLQQRLHVFGLAFSGQELRRLAYAFGPMWLVAPFALRGLGFARRGLVLVGLCAVALSVSFDAGRTMFPSAPVFYVATAWVASSRRRLAIAVVLALVAVDVGYAVYMQAHGVAHGIDGTGSGPIPVR